ncbi:MAG: cytochrome c biogenesis CcdA family protein [Thermomicrobiales bacterium]
MGPDVSLIAAFVAGILSISSPCVLPLVPLYLAHLAGTSVDQLDATSRRAIMLNAFAYVLGFSAVFVTLGIALGAASTLVSTASVVYSNRYWLVRLGGVLIIVLGLHQIGLINIPFLGRERRLDAGDLPKGQVTSSFLIGVTFGAGWSPCVGPILGAILTMAASQASVDHAAILLAVYSIGLSVPFLIAALLMGRSHSVIHRMNSRLAAVSSLSGALMLAVGAFMVLGLYQQFFARMVQAAPWPPWEPRL